MQIITNLNNINTILNTLVANDEFTSIGYVPTLNIITPADIVAIKNAIKLLDVVIVQNISNFSYDDFSLKTLQTLNPQIVINLLTQEPTELTFSLYMEQINSFNFIKAILAILPSSVFISQDNFLPFKAVNIFNDNFPNMFSLHNVSKPESLKSFMELEIITVLQNMDNKKQQISAELIAESLPNLTLINFQQYKNPQGLFVSASFEDKQTNLEASITYLFRQ
ncbi:MAG: hypothetical protein GY793_06290 [Proteobacteria bacterium]|nr:hypothetical protein [Pseudomonadota bacterium]